MDTFKEGQEVLVHIQAVHKGPILNNVHWREAIIDADILGQGLSYQVQFPDGTLAVFDVEHIRAYPVCPICCAMPCECGRGEPPKCPCCDTVYGHSWNCTLNIGASK